VILIGNLGADPEVRFTQGGSVVCNFRIATSEQWKDKSSGETKEKTEWHRIVVWGPQGERCGEYLRKGRSCYVEGRLETREWEDRDGNKRFTTEVKADRVLFLGGGNGEARGRSNDRSPKSNGPNRADPRQGRNQSRGRQSSFPPPSSNEPPPLDDTDVPW